MAQIQGSSVTMQLRESGTTGGYLNVVCETTSSLSGSASVSTEVTKCNTLTSVASPTVTFSVEGIAETSPDSAQVSINQLLGWFTAKTLLDIVYEDPEGDGTNFYVQGSGYMTEFGITAPSEGNVSFTASFQLTGNIDVIPEVIP
jgi:polyisoprenoid-binding protein YceI